MSVWAEDDDAFTYEVGTCCGFVGVVIPPTDTG